MYAILSDEQTLLEHPSGLTLTILESETYTAEGFWYELYTLDCNDIDIELFIVKKCVSDTEFDTFICYRPLDVEFGGSDNFPFLFNDDESYKEQIVKDDGVVFEGNLICIDCEVNFTGMIKPGKITEYQGPDNQANPFIFALEAINDDTGESFIQYVCGIRVNEKEVELC